MKELRLKQEQSYRRIKRIRRRIFGTGQRPRLAVRKTNRHIFTQLIDDTAGKTLAAASTLSLSKGNKMERAAQAGETLAKLAVKTKITKVVFDRRGARFHGRIKAFADAARKAGLNF